LNFSTGITEQWTKDPAEDLHPTWSPDGTKIAFQSNRAGNWDIWVIPATPDDMHPRLAVDSDGDVHKVWMREVSSNHFEAWYAELDGAGPGFNVSPFQVSDIDAYNSVYPSIALDTYNHAHVVWIDFRNNNVAEIYYSKIQDETGTDLTNEKLLTDVLISKNDGYHSGRAVLPAIDGTQTKYIEHPDIVVDPLFDYVSIVWSDERDNPGVWEVYYQQQTNEEVPYVLKDDLEISVPVDGINSMCPVIDVGLGLIHFAWQDERHGCWEIYYQGRSADDLDKIDNLSRVISEDNSATHGAFNSASPDIGVDSRYIHIVWMDQRDKWWQDVSCSEECPHQYDGQQFYWEVYKVLLTSRGDFAPEPGRGKAIKRHSDMVLDRMCGKYTGPGSPTDGPDGFSMYPRIAVNSLRPFTDKRLTHIAWHDNRDGNWKIYYTEMQSWCENVTVNKIVTIDDSLNMYPDVALDPQSDYERAHLKWQTYRQGFWRIYETRRKGKGDADAEYIIAELYRDEAPSDIFTFNLHPIYLHQDATTKPITYGFAFSLAQPGNYHFRICARDSAGNECYTDWIDGPKVLLEMRFLTGIYSTFNYYYDVVNEHNVVELYIRVNKEAYSNMIYDIEIFPETQRPSWESVEALEPPEGWSFEKVGSGLKFYTDTNPLLLCQGVKFKFKVKAERISWVMRTHVTDQDHHNMGMIISTRWWLYNYYLV